jgi:WD40 repeat protein
MLLLAPVGRPDAQSNSPPSVFTNPRRLGFGAISQVLWSADGGTLGLAAEGGVYLLPYAAGSHQFDRLHTRLIPTDQIPAQGMAFRPDGLQIAVALVNGTVRLIDRQTGQTTATLSGGAPLINKVVYSPDGQWLAFADADMVRLFDVKSRQLRGVFPGHSSVAFSADSALIASPSEGTTPGEYKLGVGIWDIQSGKLLTLLTGSRGIVRTVIFSPDGTQLLAGGDSGSIARWFIKADQLQSTTMTEYQPSFTIDATTTFRNGVVQSINFSPNDPEIAVALIARDFYASGDVGLIVWNIYTGEVLLREITADMVTVAFQPHGNILAVGGKREVALWDVRSAQPLVSISDVGPRIICCNPDRAVYMSNDPHLVVWENKLFDSQTGVEVGSWLDGNMRLAMTLNKDGTLIATHTAGVDTESLTVYMVSQSKTDFQVGQIVSFESNDGVRAFTLAADDSLVSLAPGTNTITVFEPRSSRVSHSYVLPTEIIDNELWPDPYLVIPGPSNTVTIRHLTKPTDYTLAADGSIYLEPSVIPPGITWYGFGYRDYPKLYSTVGNPSVIETLGNNRWTGQVFAQAGPLHITRPHNSPDGALNGMLDDLLNGFDPALLNPPADILYVHPTGTLAVMSNFNGEWVWDRNVKT